jgi:hypothetical protein
VLFSQPTRGEKETEKLAASLVDEAKTAPLPDLFMLDTKYGKVRISML